MKNPVTLSIESTLLEKAKEILERPPKQSLSSFVENKLYELIGKNELTNSIKNDVK